MSQEIEKYQADTTELVKRNDVSSVITTALTNLVTSRDELPALKASIESIKIMDPATYAQMGTQVQRARTIAKLGESEIRPLLNKVNEVRNFLLDAIKIQEKECEAIADVGARQQAEWNRQERLRTEREQRELNERNRKAAQEAADKLKREQAEQAARDKDAKIKEIREALRAKDITKAQAAKQLKDAGADEEAALAQASADADEIRNNPKKETVLPNKTTVSGQRARAPLVYEIVDINKIPRELLYPNVDQKTGKYRAADFPQLNQMVKGCATEAEAESKARGGIKVKREDRV